MSVKLQAEVEQLKKKFLTFTTQVEENVHAATKAFLNNDKDAVAAIIERDKDIDRMEIDIEEDCLQIIAVYRPVAMQLRNIVGILKMNNDFERIGDLSVNIAKKVIRLGDAESKASNLVPEMINKVHRQLRNCLDAFVNMDEGLALQVLQQDDDVDDLDRKIKRNVLEDIRHTPGNIDLMLGLLETSRHLERIADLTTNIAENVIYVIHGQIVRHQKN